MIRVGSYLLAAALGLFVITAWHETPSQVFWPGALGGTICGLFIAPMLPRRG